MTDTFIKMKAKRIVAVIVVVIALFGYSCFFVWEQHRKLPLINILKLPLLILRYKKKARASGNAFSTKIWDLSSKNMTFREHL